jgi:hypothetical protein
LSLTCAADATRTRNSLLPSSPGCTRCDGREAPGCLVKDFTNRFRGNAADMARNQWGRSVV